MGSAEHGYGLGDCFVGEGCREELANVQTII
jgi:hypothetical protein